MKNEMKLEQTPMKWGYVSPQFDVILVEHEQGITTSSSTMTVGGGTTTTPDVTDWQDEDHGTTIDL